ncbi:MAG TPA: histidine phosphatase family protein [Ktedonobacteraceae bacterium]|nr:histidine phosphatase family protein [Ktedonobacteraceae bacterium]
MTHIYAIRHGQVDGLKPGINGSIVPDSGLSLKGVTQAERLRDRLMSTGEIQADVLISSPLNRAKETAEIIAPALGLPMLIDDGVQEFCLGETEGLTEAEIQSQFGLVKLYDEPFRPVSPNGDSLAQFVTRTCEAIDRLTRQYEGQTMVIVCHGGVIIAMFAYFMGLNMLQPLPIVFDFGNTSITHWFHGHSDGWAGPAMRWHLKRYNDYAHLQDS